METSLADIIDQLFTQARSHDEPEPSMADVARWCTEWLREREGGGTFSREYLRQLRSGLKTNPTKRHLEALAAYFNVPAAVFLEPEQSKAILDDLELATALRDAGVQGLALRAVNLDPDGRKQVLKLIRSLEGRASRRSR